MPLAPASLRRTTALARILMVLLVVAFLAAWDVPARADDSGGGKDPGRMVLVLDSSGSMKEKAAGGETKIAAAKTALTRVIGSLPEDQAVGLRVYGATVFSAKDAGACTDSQLVVPVETDNRDDLREAVSTYKPYGETPIGYALQEAGKDLGDEGKRTIVLVSDGEPTCDPDPCQVARQLSKTGVNLKIDVVGLDVDGQARDKLRCIAAAGNGTYYDVDSSEELASSLEKLATRAARPFTAIGQPVAGTPTEAGAPTITDGDWLDEVGAQDDQLTRTYAVQREIPGSTLHVSASLRTASSEGEKVELRLKTPEGQECGFASNFTQLSAGQLLSAGASADDIDSFGQVQESSPCTESPTIIATATDDPVETTGARPLEIRVIEEPPVEDVASLPAPVKDPTWAAAPGGKATGKTTGGASFEDAPLLEPGVYRDAIVPGETLTYQVDAAWGQQVVATADFPSPTGKLAQAIGNLDMFARIDAFGPGRAAAGYTSVGGGKGSQAFVPNAQSLAVSTGTAPVTYLNRGASAPQAAASLAGPYTVTVFLEQDPDAESYLVPFQLRLGVAGDSRPGPSYVEQASSSASPSTSATAGPSPSDTSSPSTDASSSTSGDDGPGFGIYLGALGVLALLGAGYLGYRSRSTATH